jgi:hypothetical protein
MIKIPSLLRKKFKRMAFDLLESRCVDLSLPDAYTFVDKKVAHHKRPRMWVEMQDFVVTENIPFKVLAVRKYAPISAARDRMVKKLVAKENRLFKRFSKPGYKGHYFVYKNLEEPQLKMISGSDALHITLWYQLGVSCVRRKL